MKKVTEWPYRCVRENCNISVQPKYPSVFQEIMRGAEICNIQHRLMGGFVTCQNRRRVIIVGKEGKLLL